MRNSVFRKIKEMIRPGQRRAKRRYTLDELLAQCDPYAPMPLALAEWDDAPVVGNEQGRQPVIYAKK